MKRSFVSAVVVVSVMTTVLYAQSKKRSAGEETEAGFAINEQAPNGLEDVYQYYQANFGMVPNLAKVMSNSPALQHSYYDTQNNIKTHAKLSPAEINIVQLAISVENHCEYCTAGHTMAGKGLYKTPEEDMQAVRMRKELSDPKLNVLRDFAMKVHEKRGEVDSADLQAFLDAGYSRQESLDVVACVAAKLMSNYTNSIAKTPLDPPLIPLAKDLPFSGH